MLVAELKRRNVFKVATAYLVVGWVVLQVAEFFFENFGAPVWAIRSFSLLVILGFNALLFCVSLFLLQRGIGIRQ